MSEILYRVVDDQRVPLTADELAAKQARELAEEAERPIREITDALLSTDAEYDPRWHEDARLGLPIHPREQDWLDRRAALRAQLIALNAETGDE